MKNKYLILIFLLFIVKTNAQIVINPKGTKILVDTSKWVLNGNKIYNKNSGNVGIGTTNPLTQFHTTLDVRFEGIGINTTNTKVLTSDALGNVTTRTFSSLLTGNAITSINGLTNSVQTFAIGTAGSNFNISSSGSIHTFNLPDASSINRGALTFADWNTFNGKENSLTFSTGLTRTANTITVNTSQNINRLSNLTTNGLIKTSGSIGDLSIATAGTDFSAGTAGLATGILKSTTGTGALSIALAADFPILNQNTTGSAATLTTPRNIHGGSFNGSADVTNIINSNFGGTGNGFTKFTGPNTTEKTFTLPNANALILTDNAAVTAPQGGTGITSYVIGDILYANSSTSLSRLADIATGNVLLSGGVSTAPSYGKVGLTTHISGVLPIINGGTNSSTALNNNRIMVSTGGSIVEAAALTNGQLLIGSTGAAPVAATLTAGTGIAITNAAGSITIASSISVINQATSLVDAITTSATEVLIPGMTITPGAGDYLIFFTGAVENNGFGDPVTISIYSNGSQIAASVIKCESFGGMSNPIGSNAYLTNLGAGQAIEVKWKVSGGTGTCHQRTLIVQKVK
ncbi:MAG: hypothetical protein IPO85_10135 [Saprospiraceae bacterium]|uniref:Uncharacterized protein n=1 Tax=Candidatus Defluviibacterium haderslevense TaxID=2981993 RepID=A0A9D7S8E4_9BACT|nr:hypothetical protein [Candidatus Defluviibacterium haderslevense]